MINENIENVNEVIIHIGTNDLSKKSPKAIVHHVDNAVQPMKSKNPDVNMGISSVFLQKNTPLNIKAIDTNKALQQYCNTHGVDFIDNSSIVFKHLLDDRLHLNDGGNK